MNVPAQLKLICRGFGFAASSSNRLRSAIAKSMSRMLVEYHVSCHHSDISVCHFFHNSGSAVVGHGTLGLYILHPFCIYADISTPSSCVAQQLIELV